MSVRIAIALALIGLGMAVIAVSVIGLFRLENAMERIHAGAVTDTLGVLLVLSGLGVLCGLSVHTAKLAALLVILWLTNPVSSHLILKMELITGRGVEPDELTGEGERTL
jgi:multicomponent Na+:H+ antiporter subunit G